MDDDRVQRSSHFLRLKPHVGYPVSRIIDILRSRPELVIPERILDAGCGFGRLSLALSSHFPYSQVVGIDIDRNCVNYAQSQAKEFNVGDRCHFRVADVRGRAEVCDTKCYDLVAFLAVHGIFSDDSLLAQCAAMFVKPGGVAVVDAALVHIGQQATLQRFRSIEDSFDSVGGVIACSEQIEYPYDRNISVRNLVACLDQSKEISINAALPRSAVEQRLKDILTIVGTSPEISKVICKVWFIRFGI